MPFFLDLLVDFLPEDCLDDQNLAFELFWLRLPNRGSSMRYGSVVLYVS